MGRSRHCVRRALVRRPTKTDASAQAIPIPEDIQPIIEAWREVCPDTSICVLPVDAECYERDHGLPNK